MGEAISSAVSLAGFLHSPSVASCSDPSLSERGQIWPTQHAVNEGNRSARERCVTGLMTFKSTKEVIEMNMPRFTAEASLFNVGTRYQATAEAPFYSGLVQPAGPFSTVVHRDRPIFCLKRVCKDVAPAGQRPRLVCHLGFGIWSPVTGRCE